MGSHSQARLQPEGSSPQQAHWCGNLLESRSRITGWQGLTAGLALLVMMLLAIAISACSGLWATWQPTQESSKINPSEIEYKTYCPGIGIVQDQSLILASYGYEGSKPEECGEVSNEV